MSKTKDRDHDVTQAASMSQRSLAQIENDLKQQRERVAGAGNSARLAELSNNLDLLRQVAATDQARNMVDRLAERQTADLKRSQDRDLAAREMLERAVKDLDRKQQAETERSGTKRPDIQDRIEQHQDRQREDLAELTRRTLADLSRRQDEQGARMRSEQQQVAALLDADRQQLESVAADQQEAARRQARDTDEFIQNSARAAGEITSRVDAERINQARAALERIDEQAGALSDAAISRIVRAGDNQKTSTQRVGQIQGQLAEEMFNQVMRKFVEDSGIAGLQFIPGHELAQSGSKITDGLLAKRDAETGVFGVLKAYEVKSSHQVEAGLYATESTSQDSRRGDIERLRYARDVAREAGNTSAERTAQLAESFRELGEAGQLTRTLERLAESTAGDRIRLRMNGVTEDFQRRETVRDMMAAVIPQAVAKARDAEVEKRRQDAIQLGATEQRLRDSARALTAMLDDEELGA